jgi:endonuclease/exonuclease/phosphatase (EEP) superfamily protein YafD
VVAWAGSWVVSGRVFPVDLAASFQSAAVVVAGALLVIGAALRRWGAVGLCGLAMAVGGWPLVQGRSVSVGPVDVLSPPGPGVVRIVSFNIGPESPVWEEDMRRVLGWHADAVVLLETPPTLWRFVERDGGLRGEGWSSVHRSWVEELVSPCFVLSRHRLERVGLPGVEHGDRDILLTRVGTGSGDLLVLAVHPHSPRTRGRWELGNAMMARTMAGAVPEAERLRLPLVMAADLNAGPAAWRSRAARAAGLRMAKPLTGGWGTFAASWAGPLRVQIDDVWLGPGVRAVGWSSFAPIGSDHRVVVADLVIQAER